MLDNVRWKLYIRQAAGFFRRHFPINKHICIVHHNGADGVAGSVILTDAVSRIGGTVTSIAVEKLYPALIEKIHSSQQGLVIYLDLASNCASSVMMINQGRCHVLIIDHHLPVNAQCPFLYHCNPCLIGLRGDKHIASSGLAYLLVNELGLSNKDLSFLSIVGAIAHRQDRGTLQGLNYGLYKRVEKSGQLITHNIEYPRDSLIQTLTWSCQSQSVTLADFVSDLDKLGYTSAGVEIARKLCTIGYSDLHLNKVQEVNKKKNEQYQQLRDLISQGGLRQSNSLQWFCLDNRFDSMSLKAIWEFMTQIQHEDFFEPYKYIVAFRRIPTVFPEIGLVKLNSTEALIRLPAVLEQRMYMKSEPSLLDFVAQATHSIGGVVDSCHSHVAAITIPNGSETTLRDAMHQYLSRSRLQSRATG